MGIASLTSSTNCNRRLSHTRSKLRRPRRSPPSTWPSSGRRSRTSRKQKRGQRSARRTSRSTGPLVVPLRLLDLCNHSYGPPRTTDYDEAILLIPKHLAIEYLNVDLG